MKFRLKKTKKGGVDVGRLEIFKERYEDLNMPLDPNKPLELPEFVAIITGDPAHRLDVCMCIREKAKKGKKGKKRTGNWHRFHKSLVYG